MKAYAPTDTAELNKRFGERLRELRKRAGMTQGALAQSIGLERTSITNIESGLQTVNVPTLVRICEVLRITPSQVVPLEIRSTGKALSHMPGQYALLAREILKNSSDAT